VNHFTEWVVPLPGGFILADGRRLSQAELCPLTGREEEWLTEHPHVPSALAVSRILSACLLRLDDVPSTPELVRNLLVGDRDYLMLHLRRITLGETIAAVIVCPACTQKMDVDFVIGDVPVAWRPQEMAIYPLDLGVEGKQPGRTVQFRLPTGRDQETVLSVPAEMAVATLLSNCLVDDGGVPLSTAEQEAVIEAMEALAPQVDLELDLTCPECGHAFLVPFDTTAFFFGEVRATGDKLLKEVHTLALYYHWSEQEILALTRARRRGYLALLSESLRGE
jgi:hypothetical protein